MTRATLLWAAVLVTASCGRDRGSGEGADCGPGQHLALEKAAMMALEAR
jgi:hypothetical protein